MKGWGTEGDVVLLELLSGTGLAERSSQGLTRGIIFKVEQVEEPESNRKDSAGDPF